MSTFTSAEVAYLASQRLGRLATVNERGEPHVVPVSFRYNPLTATIDIGGHNLARSKKYRDVARGSRMAFVVDDVLPPWQPRGIEVRGEAQTLAEGGRDINAAFDAETIRVTPRRIVAWGLDTDAFHPNSRAV